MGNIFGRLFRITTWGESHGGNIGVVVDGCPPGLPLDEACIQLELDRRRPGQSEITSQRKESDTVTITSGVYKGRTLGTPIALTIPNRDARPEAYAEMREKFRPSHADYTYQAKFGHRMPEGGGRSSARETAGRVAAGAIARRILKLGGDVDVVAYVTRIHDIEMPELTEFPSIAAVDADVVRCPHAGTAQKMIKRIKQVRSEGDSVGGVILGRVRNLPPGLGAPVFDRLEADLAKGMLSLPATKGFEVGSGFAGTFLKGSEHNDAFIATDDGIGTLTNRSGGVQGGISNGEELYFRVAFKPTATIIREQQTVDIHGHNTLLRGRGRHDPCVLPRAVPIVEAMTAIVLVDHWLLHYGQNEAFEFSGT